MEQRAAPLPAPHAPTSYRRWLPTMSPATNSEELSLSGLMSHVFCRLFIFLLRLGHAFPLLPIDDAWLFATRTVFLYPELLPVCSLAIKRNHRATYTPGENRYQPAHTGSLTSNHLPGFFAMNTTSADLISVQWKLVTFVPNVILSCSPPSAKPRA